MSYGIKQKYSFTLIEMLIVVVIIGILAAALIPKLQNVQDRAKKSKAQAALRTMSTWVFQAELNTDKLLKDITNSFCTELACRSITVPLSTLPETSTCRTGRIASITKIAQAAGEHGESDYYKDPRGSPYLLDENETENGPTDCRFDSLQSAGADGKRVYDNNLYPNQNDAASNNLLNKDNIFGSLRPVRCKGTY